MTNIIIRNAQQHDFGGGERFPVFLADILQKADVNTVIISRSEKLLAFATDHSIKTVRGWWWSQQSYSGKRVLLFPVYLVWQCLLFVWYLQVFIRNQPDAVHIQSKDDFIAATLAGKLCGARIIWTDHADLKHIWKNIGIWYKNPVGKLVYAVAHFADAITLVSESEKVHVSKHISATNPIAKKLTVIYNGVVDSSKHYKSLPQNDVFTFCVASRLVTDKGIGEVITAFSRLAKKHPKSALILMGDGPKANLFKTQAKQNNSIRFIGHKTNPLTYIAAADAFVHPTYHEGFSVALVEASMLSRPIIATSVGGNVEIIRDGETGLLVPAKDVDSLYAAMLRLVEDNNLRKTLGANARKQYLDRFNFDTIVKKQFMPLYEGNK